MAVSSNSRKKRTGTNTGSMTKGARAKTPIRANGTKRPTSEYREDFRATHAPRKKLYSLDTELDRALNERKGMMQKKRKVKGVTAPVGRR